MYPFRQSLPGVIGGESQRFDGREEGCVIGGVDFVDVGGFRMEHDKGEIRCIEVVEYTKEQTCFVRINSLQLDRGYVLFP